MRKNGLVLLSIVFATFVQTNALVILRDGSEPEPYPTAIKRFFSYYHNRNAPSSTKYPFVVRNPPKKQKPKTLPISNSSPASSSNLRNLMETMTDDEIINEILNMEMEKAVVLAKDIITDLRIILKQVRSSEAEQEELENTIQ